MDCRSCPRPRGRLGILCGLFLAPLLLIVIAVAGLVFGQDAAQGQIIGQIQGLVGEESAKAIQSMIEEARKPAAGIIATVLALVLLLLGATGVFAQLQETLNIIWRVEAKPEQGIWKILKDRFISLLAVLGTGFLLLISLVISAGLSAIAQALEHFLPVTGLVLQLINFFVSFAIVTLLFAMIYKLLPDASIQWSDVWIGAIITSLLFTIGKFVIGFYLGSSDVGLAYGAAGSLVVILIWVYYASQIFLFGAEFTAVYAESRGSGWLPRHTHTRSPWSNWQAPRIDAPPNMYVGQHKDQTIPHDRRTGSYHHRRRPGGAVCGPVSRSEQARYAAGPLKAVYGQVGS